MTVAAYEAAYEAYWTTKDALLAAALLAATRGGLDADTWDYGTHRRSPPIPSNPTPEERAAWDATIAAAEKAIKSLPKSIWDYTWYEKSVLDSSSQRSTPASLLIAEPDNLGGYRRAVQHYWSAPHSLRAEAPPQSTSRFWIDGLQIFAFAYGVPERSNFFPAGNYNVSFSGHVRVPGPGLRDAEVSATGTFTRASDGTLPVDVVAAELELTVWHYGMLAVEAA